MQSETSQGMAKAELSCPGHRTAAAMLGGALLRDSKADRGRAELRCGKASRRRAAAEQRVATPRRREASQCYGIAWLWSARAEPGQGKAMPGSAMAKLDGARRSRGKAEQSRSALGSGGGVSRLGMDAISEAAAMHRKASQCSGIAWRCCARQRRRIAGQGTAPSCTGKANHSTSFQSKAKWTNSRSLEGETNHD